VEDIRKHKLRSQTITIRIELEVVIEEDKQTPRMLTNISDELAVLLSQRMTNTPGVIHLNTVDWDVSMQ
jgi:hypothetical protein